MLNIGTARISDKLRVKADELLTDPEWRACIYRVETFMRDGQRWRRYIVRSTDKSGSHHCEVCLATGDVRCDCEAGSFNAMCSHLVALWDILTGRAPEPARSLPGLESVAPTSRRAPGHVAGPAGGMPA